MPQSLDALQTLLSGGSDLNSGNSFGLVQNRLKKEQQLLEMKKAALISATNAHAADVQDAQQDLDESPYFGKAEQARVAGIQQTQDELATANRPEMRAAQAEDQARKVALAAAPAESAAKGNLAVEQAKTEGAMRLKQQQDDSTQKLLETLTGGGGGNGSSSSIGGPGSSVKPTINAQGGVSFTTTQMPALVQRARNQLLDARDKTLNTLHEAEKQYPGINDAADRMDATPPGSGSALGRLFSGLTGVGSEQYGGPGDRVNAGIERANYALGIPTPFATLAQEASFGNIEQMAGQLPGVRGLATLTPMFKEHQTRWGHETPLATVQRARHMAKIMDETLHTIDSGGAGGDTVRPEY